MSAVPVWLQVTACVVTILASLTGMMFGAFVLWPSIRRQNALAVKFQAWLAASEKKALDELIEKL